MWRKVSFCRRWTRDAPRRFAFSARRFATSCSARNRRLARWCASASAVDRIFTALTLALGGIASISLGVAGILIMNVMLIAVTQRTNEIGLLKAIGATPQQIRAVFFTEAAMLSASGGVVGSLVGQLG